MVRMGTHSGRGCWGCIFLGALPGLPFTPTASPISDPLRVLSSLLISFGMLSSTSESAKAKRGCRLTLVIAQYRY